MALSAASSSTAPANYPNLNAASPLTLSISPLQAENALDVIPVPPISDLEPITVYPGRRHYFHVDSVALLDAFLARNTSDFQVFQEEFDAMKFSYIVEMHPKELPQDVMSVLADVIYDLARHSKYRLGCVYMLYLVYYSQEATNRHSLSICMEDLRMLDNIARVLSPTNAIVGHLFAKMVADDAFMVSFQKCPTSAYFSGSGFYYRLSRDHVFTKVANACTERRKCETDGHRLLAQDGSTIIDFEALAPRVATLPDHHNQVFQRARARFDDYKKHQKPERPSRCMYVQPPKWTPSGPRMKKRESPIAKRNSERLGVRAALARVSGVPIDDVDFSQVIPDDIDGVSHSLRIRKRKPRPGKHEFPLLALTDGTTLPTDPSTPSSAKNVSAKNSAASSSLPGNVAQDAGMKRTSAKQKTSMRKNARQNKFADANAATANDDTPNRSSAVERRPPKRRSKNQVVIVGTNAALPDGARVSIAPMEQIPLCERSSSQDQVIHAHVVSARGVHENKGPVQQETRRRRRPEEIDANAMPLHDGPDCGTPLIHKMPRKKGTIQREHVDAKATSTRGVSKNGTRMAMKTQKSTKAKANGIVDANALTDDVPENRALTEQEIPNAIVDAKVDSVNDSPENSTLVEWEPPGKKRKRSEIVDANVALADDAPKRCRLMAIKIPKKSNAKQSQIVDANTALADDAPQNGRLMAIKIPKKSNAKQSQIVDANSALADDAPENSRRVVTKKQRRVKTRMGEIIHANADVVDDAPEYSGEIVHAHAAVANTVPEASAPTVQKKSKRVNAKRDEIIDATVGNDVPDDSGSVARKPRGGRSAKSTAGNDVPDDSGTVARTPRRGRSAKSTEGVEPVNAIPERSNLEKQTTSRKRRGTKDAVAESAQNASMCDVAPSIKLVRKRSRARNDALVDDTSDAAGATDDPPQSAPDKCADAKLGKSRTGRNARRSSCNGSAVRRALVEQTQVPSSNGRTAHEKTADIGVARTKSAIHAWANITPLIVAYEKVERRIGVNTTYSEHGPQDCATEKNPPGGPVTLKTKKRNTR